MFTVQCVCCRVYSYDGTERLRNSTRFRPPAQPESHVYGQYAAPYWLEKHIRVGGLVRKHVVSKQHTSRTDGVCVSTQTSESFTEDLNDADAVFVDDYCYSVAWIAQEQSEEAYKDGFDPRAQLVKGYTRLMDHPRRAAPATDALWLAQTSWHQ